MLKHHRIQTELVFAGCVDGNLASIRHTPPQRSLITVVHTVNMITRQRNLTAGAEASPSKDRPSNQRCRITVLGECAWRVLQRPLRWRRTFTATGPSAHRHAATGQTVRTYTLRTASARGAHTSVSIWLTRRLWRQTN
jgi:hypothetical protein